MSSGAPLVDAYLDELLADVAMVEDEAPVSDEDVAAMRAAALATAPSSPTVAPGRHPREGGQPVPHRDNAPSLDPRLRGDDSERALVRDSLPLPVDTNAIGTPTMRAIASSSRWLRVGMGGDHYAFELLRVQEVVRVAPIVAMRGATAAVLGVMNLRGRIVPVFDLGRWLGTTGVIADEHSRIVVVERADELIGVLVTAVEDVATLGREHIEPPLAGNAPGAIVGVARVGHAPTVLLDANALFD